MKKLFCILTAVIFYLIPLAACGGKSAGGYVVPDYADDIRIDIGAYITPPKPLVSLERYKDIAAAGINFLNDTGGTIGVRGYTVNDALAAMDYAKEAGLKVFVDDYQVSLYNRGTTPGNWRADFSTNFPKYSVHEAYAGNFICDEPGAIEFGNLKTISDAFNLNAPAGKTTFINLYPSYANPAGGVGEGALGGSFDEYVENFMETVRPSVLSYDHYPLLRNDWDGGADMRPLYFSDMETVRHIAKKYGVPTHNFILSTEHLGYVFPTETDIRWQIAVNQAFGITSFSYFTYWLPTKGDDHTVPFSGYYNAPVNADGTKTALYDYIKAVNYEVLAWDHVYLRFDWQGTAAISGAGGEYAFSPLSHLKRANYPDGIEGVKSIASTGDVLCGIFKDADGNAGFMLTNATNPYDRKTVSVTVRFDGAYKGVQIFEKGVPQISGLDKNGGKTIELKAGEGKFLIPLKKA